MREFASGIDPSDRISSRPGAEHERQSLAGAFMRRRFRNYRVDFSKLARVSFA
jgi:hypothetical protein